MCPWLRLERLSSTKLQGRPSSLPKLPVPASGGITVSLSMSSIAWGSNLRPRGWSVPSAAHSQRCSNLPLFLEGRDSAPFIFVSPSFYLPLSLLLANQSTVPWRVLSRCLLIALKRPLGSSRRRFWLHLFGGEEASWCRWEQKQQWCWHLTPQMGKLELFLGPTSSWGEKPAMLMRSTCHVGGAHRRHRDLHRVLWSSKWEMEGLEAEMVKFLLKLLRWWFWENWHGMLLAGRCLLFCFGRRTNSLDQGGPLVTKEEVFPEDQSDMFSRRLASLVKKALSWIWRG